MKKKKKLHIRKPFKIILIIYIVLLVISIPYFFIDIRLVGKDEVTLDYGEKYSEAGFKGSFFGKNISKNIKVSNNIKKNIGEYEVKYSYRWLIYRKIEKRTIIIKDVSPPKIELTGNNPYSVEINTKYEEPGFKATDNLDGDVTKKVKVKNNVDITKLGKYKVTYTVKDKAGNKTVLEREVHVDKKLPTQMSLEEYTLEGYDENYQLKETPKNEEYFKQVIFVGDSNIKNLFLSKFIPGNQAWYLPCIHAESYFHEKLYIGGRERILLIDAVEKYKPKYLLLNLGVFSTAWIDEDVFINKSNELIEEIKKKSPDTRIILSSIYPIREGKNINDFDQSKINRYNYTILQMAKKHNIKFLNVQEVLKGKDGYGDNRYFLDDKFHFTDAGRTVLLNYIKTHAWEE